MEPPHQHPHVFPTSELTTRNGLLAGLVVAVIAAFCVAGYNRGQVLLAWDEPIQRFVESHRNGVLDSFFLRVTVLGGRNAALSVPLVGVIATWRRCRAVALALLTATLARPLMEAILKLVVGRERPQLRPFGTYEGFAFPSGHVLASIALWGMLPVVVTVFTRSRKIWWASVAVSGALVASISASRVYLGAHWFSDVVVGLAVGALFLVAVEAVLEHQHARHSCRITLT